MKDNESWQICYNISVDKPIYYYLHEFYSGKQKEIPNRLQKIIKTLLTSKEQLNNKLCKIESKLGIIIEKIIK